MKPVEPDKIDYQNIDLAYTNYGMDEQQWNDHITRMDKHLADNPICQMCKEKPSVRITPVGTLYAACEDCLDGIDRELQAAREESRREIEEENRLWEERQRRLREEDEWY